MNHEDVAAALHLQSREDIKKVYKAVATGKESGSRRGNCMPAREHFVFSHWDLKKKKMLCNRVCLRHTATKVPLQQLQIQVEVTEITAITTDSGENKEREKKKKSDTKYHH